MFVRLKFSQGAAKAILDDGIDDLDELQNMTDETVERLVENCRKPGGADAGHAVSTTAENYLKLCVFGLKHKLRTSQEIDVDNIDLDWCRSFMPQRNLEGAWTTTIDTLTDGD